MSGSQGRREIYMILVDEDDEERYDMFAEVGEWESDVTEGWLGVTMLSGFGLRLIDEHSW
jgi:hypothetical protein